MGKTLAQSNFYLHDSDRRSQSMTRNIESSSAIEGIKIVRDVETGRFVSKKEVSGSNTKDSS